MGCVAAPPVARALVRAPSEECNGSGVHGSGWRLCRGGSGGGGQRPWLRAIDQDLHCEVSPSASGENVQVLQIVADDMRARARTHTHTHTHQTTYPLPTQICTQTHKGADSRTPTHAPTHLLTHLLTHSYSFARSLARSLTWACTHAHTHTRRYNHASPLACLRAIVTAASGENHPCAP